MSSLMTELERRALECMKNGEFGSEAIEVNAAIIEQAPKNVSAWVRLGRCHLEQRHWDEAVSALRGALQLSPTHTVATNLLNEVRKRRALAPTAVQRATTGFSAREFALVEALPSGEACDALRPRIEALFDAVNQSSIAAKIVEARQRRGESGSKLFQANSFHANATGHVFAFHHGGRWEPQFNLGWFSAPPHPANCLRIGLGFNLSATGRGPDRANGQERVLASFDRFQRTLENAWKTELVRWMAANGGFIQYGDHSPAVDVLPERAVEWLVHCRNAAALEWIFVGRWLFLEKPDDAKVLADRAKLASLVDDAFRTLFPLWLGCYTGSTA
ncbi:MAG TPA: tetratricopeptide repeat protein [Vicinamibacterales bacterium]|nr:tetratricopeptide repeat protein [Vicinamibacterales bacterium]